LQDAWLLNEGVATYSAVCEIHECDEELVKFFAEVREIYTENPDSIPGKYNVEVSSIMPNTVAEVT